jgi:hypothetical protein
MRTRGALIAAVILAGIAATSCSGLDSSGDGQSATTEPSPETTAPYYRTDRFLYVQHSSDCQKAAIARSDEALDLVTSTLDIPTPPGQAVSAELTGAVNEAKAAIEQAATECARVLPECPGAVDDWVAGMKTYFDAYVRLQDARSRGGDIADPVIPYQIVRCPEFGDP